MLEVVGRIAFDAGFDVVATGDLGAIPMFDPAIGDDDAPAAVIASRTTFESADAIVVAVPEYGGGTAGWAKNALDWMVGSGARSGPETFDGLAGDRSDEVEVLVDVQDGESCEFGGGGDEEVGDRWGTMLASVG